MNNSQFLHDRTGRIPPVDAEYGKASGVPSRDFWLVFAACLLGLMGCFLLIVGVSEYNTRRWRKRFAKDEELALAKPSNSLSCAQREVFRGSRYGVSFAFHMDLAWRGALVTFFCAATYGANFLNWWQRQGWSMSYVVVIVVFTLYKDLGSTVVLAWTGFYGTLLPVLNCWLIFYLFPDGVKKDETWTKVFGWVDFLVFVLLMFGLGFATNGKMYALSWQAYFSMCFLNPFDQTLFSQGLDVQLHAAETSALTGTIIGCIFALLVAAWMNISALRKAQHMMLDLTWSHGRLLEQLLEMGCLRMRPQAASVFAVEVQSLQQQLLEIRGLLKSSWWECFDLGAAGQSRLMLLEMCRNLDFLIGWLESMVMAVQHAKLSNPNPAHELHPSPHIFDLEKLRDLIESAREALQQSCQAAVQGISWDAEEESHLEFWLSALEDAQMKAHEALKAKFMPSGSWQRLFTSAHLPQFALASSASGYSQKVADLLIAMAEFEPSEVAVGPCRGFLLGLRALPGADLQTWKAVMNCLKLSVAFTLCFVIGWFGIGMQTGSFVPAFNATPAGTVAYLIFQGGNQAAALKKNMDRFMGVAFGSLLGTLTVGLCGSLKAFVGWDVAAFLFLGIYFAFEFLALFVYFSSPTFSYAGLMFCCFYANSALRPLDRHDGFSKSGALQKPNGVRLQCESDYQSILSQLIAILVATLMDVIADESLSIRATAKLESFAKLVDEGSHLLRAAAADGSEAAREPRCLGVPWRSELWSRVMKVCNETWQCLTIVTTTESPVTHQEKSLRRSVEILCGSPSFQEKLRSLQLRTQKAFQLTMGYLRQNYYDERNTEMIELQEEMIIRASFAETGLHQIIAELHTDLRMEEGARQLLDNPVCAVAMFLMMFEALVAREVQLETAILEQPEVWQLLTEKDFESELSVRSSDSLGALHSFCV
ncbi:unnamed protein product [Symbiodinium sp. KB8]|nr:unnamed protein product [Symbiodinium sp. KB8]